MPRERRDRSLSVDRPVMPHFLSSSSSSHPIPSENVENIKEWEDARCPVCIEHPHNAVLLLCSSHDKGCRPYMCDTSYRHSNCFDKFCKSFVESKNEEEEQQQQQQQVEEDQEENPTTFTSSITEAPVMSTPVLCEKQVKENLVCPLCRGQVSQWVVMESARNFMDLKTRTCASETCEFTGTYKDLRKHARLEHPTERPSEADPERQRNWRRMERQRDLGDLISTLQSSTGEEWAEDGTLPIDEGGWLTVFFLIRVFRPGTTLSRSNRTARIARLREQAQPQPLQPPPPTVRRRRSARLWGETRNTNDETAPGSRENNNNDSQSSEDGFGPWRRHVRRRFAPEEDEE